MADFVRRTDEMTVKTQYHGTNNKIEMRNIYFLQ